MMLCAVLTGPTLAEVQQQLKRALPYADLCELRLDLLQERNFEFLKNLCEQCELPMLFTLRKKEQGGHYKGTEEERLQEIRSLLKLKPAYFDIEADTDPTFLIQQNPEVSFILSAHYFGSEHPSLKEILSLADGGAYSKIAVQTKNTVEALQLLAFMKENPGLILIGMGEAGQLTRILGSVFGVPLTYAAIDEKSATAPGQLTLKTLHDIYRAHLLSASTRMYGLLGDPVSRSISDRTHNHIFAQGGMDAVYVKLRVTPQEVEQVLALLYDLQFYGLSVTTPLKEEVIPFLEKIDPYAEEIGSVNTLVRGESRFIGYNTDGPGGLNAIENHFSVQDKRIVILGAGPAARALAFEAKKRGASVVMANRTEEKGQTATKKLGIEYCSLNAIPSYDLIVNATSSEVPIPLDQLRPDTWAMDISTYPKRTQFLNAAAEKGASLIFGYEKFVEQATLQFQLWGFPNVELINTLLFSEAENVLGSV